MFITVNDFENIQHNLKLDFYQQPFYLRTEAIKTNSEPIYWYNKEGQFEFLIPLLKKNIEFGGKVFYDLSSPYGYPGFISNKRNIDSIESSIKLFDEQAKNSGYVSTFIRLNPLYNNILFLEDNLMSQNVLGNIVLVDLNCDYEIAKMDFSSNHKRDIKKLKNKGLVIEHNPINAIDEFIDIYNESMDRLNADDYYYFENKYYQELKDQLKDDLDFVLIKDSEGDYICGGIFIKNNKNIYYHLGGTKQKASTFAPSKLMFDFVIQKHSNTKGHLNLGGGLGSQDDSLYKFKKGFSKQTKKFSTLKIIHNKNIYDNLCVGFSKEDKKNLNNFFPLYRKSN